MNWFEIKWFFKMNWFEIKWFFKMNWPILLFIVVILACGILSAHYMKNYKSPPEQIQIEAKGVISGIRNTGSWNIYDTEVKFSDGSIILLQYSTVRRYKLKHGQNIEVIHSSYKGRYINVVKN